MTSMAHMIGVHDIWLFLLAGFLLNVTPGPDMALIIARSSQRGVKAGIAAALGVGAGAFVHIAAAMIGLSALIMTSATLFDTLKWAGALYLVYVGIEIVRTAGRGSPAKGRAAEDAPGDCSRTRIFVQGFLTNALNPKVAIFFLAFLPQFVDAGAPSKVAAFFFLGAVFTTVGTIWNIGIAWCAGRAASALDRGRARAWVERTIGLMFVGIGVRLALSERP